VVIWSNQQTYVVVSCGIQNMAVLDGIIDIDTHTQVVVSSTNIW
jgi:hypothetical protein